MSFKIDPSTYKQVVKNAQALANLGDLSDVPYDINQLYEYVNKLKEMILDAPSTGGDGDVTVDTEGNMKVIGIHVNTSNSETNNLIADYNQGITFEIKNTQVIGIRGSEGFTGNYCLVQTAKQDTSLEGEPNTDRRIHSRSRLPTAPMVCTCVGVMHSRMASGVSGPRSLGPEAVAKLFRRMFNRKTRKKETIGCSPSLK